MIAACVVIAVLFRDSDELPQLRGVEYVCHRTEIEEAGEDRREFEVREILQCRSEELCAECEMFHALLDLLEAHVEVADAAVLGREKRLEKEERVKKSFAVLW